MSSVQVTSRSVPTIVGVKQNKNMVVGEKTKQKQGLEKTKCGMEMSCNVVMFDSICWQLFFFNIYS